MDTQFLERYYQTYNSENPEALAAFYHPEVELHSPEGVMRGPEAILDTYRYLTDQFQDTMTPLDIRIDGDSATVLIRDVFIAKRDVPDFMGTALRKGETLEMQLRGSYRVKDGLIHRIEIETTA